MTNPSRNAAYKAKDITSENFTHKIILLSMVLFMIFIYRYAVNKNNKGRRTETCIRSKIYFHETVMLPWLVSCETSSGTGFL